MENKSTLFEKIEESMKSFTSSQKSLGQYILLNHKNVAYMSVTELSSKVDVSEATVIRFCQALGYSGYLEFKDALIHQLKGERDTPMDKMLKTISNLEEINGFVGKVFQQDLSNVQETIMNFDPDDFEEVVDLMEKSRKIFVIGLNSCASLAHFIHFHIKRLGTDVEVITSGGLVLFEELAKVREGDLIFIISFPRYSKDSYKAIQVGKEMGAKVVTIIDSKENILAKSSDYVLLAQSVNSLSFMNSFVAPMALCNALVLSYGIKIKDQALDTLTRLEKLKASSNLYL